MSGFNAAKFYELLPSLYGIREGKTEAQNEQLRGLLRVLAQQAGVVERDIAALYDDWFIETCAEWVVPYLGELLGVRGLHAVSTATASERARVANTLRYRRRKGTAAMLEQLARDATGWTACVVEFFDLLATTQHLNHLRPQNLRTSDLRNINALELLDSPFESAARTADVRNLSPADALSALDSRGKYNIPHVGIFLWRLGSYPVAGGTACAVSDPADGRYTFSPLGQTAPVFRVLRQSGAETDITHLAKEDDVPGPIRPGFLRKDLGNFQQSKASVVYGPQGSFQIVKDGAPVIPGDVMCKDLSAWDRPPLGKVAVDVRLGRLAFAANGAPGTGVTLDYAYGFSADIGGGPYDRKNPELEPDTVADPQSLGSLIRVPSPGIDTLSQALAAWNPAAQPMLVIQIEDSLTRKEDVQIKLAGAKRLVIQAANRQRPVFAGEFSVSKGSGDTKLELNGLLVTGGIQVKDQLAELRLAHTTLVPGGGLNSDGTPRDPDRASLIVDEDSDNLRVVLTRSITGPLRLAAEIGALQISDSIVDAPGKTVAIAANDDGTNPAPPTAIERSTIFGPVHVLEMSLASDSIFSSLVEAKRRQVGCVRFSYLPSESKVARRYRCQPDMAVDLAAAKAREENTSLTTRQKQQLCMRLQPMWSERRYGQPAYAQLARSTPPEIRAGGSEESEMGAFQLLLAPQREANLLVSLDEYLRVGLEAGIFFVS